MFHDYLVVIGEPQVEHDRFSDLMICHNSFAAISSKMPVAKVDPHRDREWFTRLVDW